MLKASVVIPTRDRWSSLQRCLNALLSQTLPHDQYEIIVVSDGSTNGPEQGMASCASDPRVRFLQQPTQDLVAAMNCGIQLASGEIVILTRDDCVCEPDLIAAHVQAHAHEEHLVVQGPVFVHPQCPRTAVTEFLRERGQRNFVRCTTEGPGSSDLVPGANRSVRRAFLQKHPFDPASLHNAHNELGFRLQQAGARARYAASAVAYQFADKTPDALVSDTRDLSVFEVGFSRIHPAYRAMSSIAQWSRDTAKKRFLRSLLARTPFSPEPLLKLLFLLVQPLQRHAFFLRAAQRLLKLRIEVAASRAAVSAAGSWARLHASFLLRVPILLYHLVTSDSESAPNAIAMTRSTFEQQMHWLAKSGYQGIRISEFIAWRENDSPLPPKPVLITFDDAYEDTAQYGFPILQRSGFPAACMVVTGEIAQFNQWDVKLGWQPRRLMNKESLLEWKERGIEYGAHSCTHPDLRTLKENDLQQELAASRDALEQIIGSPVRTFAYPYGFLNRRVREEAERSFDFAFTTEPRPSNLASDPLLLGRMEPLHSDSYSDFISRVRWGWTPRLRLRTIFDNLFTRTRTLLRVTRARPALQAQRDSDS
ncbi:MAG TPA: glycosyltransferase [Terracidiphilus sp.]|jgi:peptidoglycan/xylan/chitin deacetylase (PgdA/CDA1 family)/glycosyltransferase involved in cell wall biosynthesis|nr:glycosyltransferase [Terracidiphilus sp.]